MITDADLAELAEMSARIGADPSLTQGPGGNTSIKDAEELWVKASGCWLANALRSPVFVGIDRAATAALASHEVPASAVIEGRGQSAGRPSIETALHLLMPHRVVIHTHAVNTMTVAVLSDGEAIARRRLIGHDWRWIPYARPGADLAREVEAALRAGVCDILILENHGVVVGAEDVAAGEALLRQVERLLAFEPRAMPPFSPESFDDLASARFVPDGLASPYAMDEHAARVLTGGALIPDQAVFLGGAVPALAPGDEVEALASRLYVATGVTPALVLLPGRGALALRSRSASAKALIAGLLAVAERVPAGAPVNVLDANEIDGLLRWDAEKYRQELNAT